MTKQRFVVPVEFDRWIEGLEDFEPGQEIVDEWDRAMQVFYGRSQETVHVISNDLRTSGGYDTKRTSLTRVRGTLTYGGTPECDYAIYEQRRGGDHDWITVAFAMCQGVFERALLDGIDAQVRSFT